MQGILILLACFAIGASLVKFRKVPENGHIIINSLIINVFMPALIFVNIREMRWDSGLIAVVVVPWLIFASSIALFALMNRIAGWDRRTVGALALTSGFSNNNFVGIPMVEAFFGPAMVGVAAISAQFGINITTNTVGVATAAYCGGKEPPKVAALLKRIAFFPPFIAFVLAILSIEIPLSRQLIDILQRLGGLLAPMAMISVGLQVRFTSMAEHTRPLLAAIFFRLVFAPLAVALVLCTLLGFKEEIYKVVVLQAAMGPSVNGAIMASEFGLNKEIASAVVAIGTLVSMASIPLVYFFLSVALPSS